MFRCTPEGMKDGDAALITGCHLSCCDAAAPEMHANRVMDCYTRCIIILLWMKDEFSVASGLTEETECGGLY